MTLFYIKGEANLFSDTFIRQTMAHCALKLAETTLEENTCELLCMDPLFISDNTDCFSFDIEEISFTLSTQTMEAGNNL